MASPLVNTRLGNVSLNQKQLPEVYSGKSPQQRKKIHTNNGTQGRLTKIKNGSKTNKHSDDNIRKKMGQQYGDNPFHDHIYNDRCQTNLQSRRLLPTVGERMCNIRLETDSISNTSRLSDLIQALRLEVNLTNEGSSNNGSYIMYESIENGTSALEEWGSILMTFALNLELPVSYLIPIVIPSLPTYLICETTTYSSPNQKKIQHKSTEETEAVVIPITSAKGGKSTTSTIIVDATANAASGEASELTSTETCGSRLRNLRIQKNVSVVELIRGTSITPSDLLTIEDGESTNGYEKWSNVIGRFSIFYGVSPLILVIDVRGKAEQTIRNTDNTKKEWKSDDTVYSCLSSSYGGSERDDNMGIYGEKSYNNNSGNDSSSNSSFLIDGASLEPSTSFLMLLEKNTEV